jgi:DNA (cytosine-5)-methyltransferase 1
LAKWPVLSLFSGAGGLDLGFEQAGFAPLVAIDIEEAAVETHAYNRQESRGRTFQRNLATMASQELIHMWIDVAGNERPIGITGGPPCQAFSVSNVHQKEDDPRLILPDVYASIIWAFNQQFGLDFFVFENVPGLLGRKHRPRYEHFKIQCQDAGFRISEKVVDAARFGVPQYRPRVIVVGINSERYPNVKMDIPEGEQAPVPIDIAIKGLPEPVHFRRGLSRDGIPYHPNHLCLAPRSRKFHDGSLKPGCAIGRSFRALKWGEPSWTVAYGHREVHVHPDCHRRLSIFEAMRLQGFPDWYELRGTLSQQIALVSDAVPPPVGKAIGAAIADALNLHGKPESYWKVPKGVLTK